MEEGERQEGRGKRRGRKFHIFTFFPAIYICHRADRSQVNLRLIFTACLASHFQPSSALAVFPNSVTLLYTSSNSDLTFHSTLINFTTVTVVRLRFLQFSTDDTAANSCGCWPTRRKGIGSDWTAIQPALFKNNNLHWI